MTGSPVDRLVPELLYPIFQYACPVPDAGKRRNRLEGRRFSWTISQVCRRWRSSALNMSQLWNYIKTEEVVMLPSLLTRSRDLPLIVVLSVGSHDEDRPNAFALANDHILQCWNRIKELQVDSLGRSGLQVGVEWRVVCAHLLKVAPQLEYLDLRGTYGQDIRPQLMGSYPALKGLSLDAVIIPWNSLARLSTLMQLRLLPWEEETPFSLFLDILHANPLLRFLECCHLGGRNPFQYPSAPLKPVHLRCLTALTTSGPVDFVQALFTHVQVPQSVNWLIHFDSYPWNNPVVIIPPSLPGKTPSKFEIHLTNNVFPSDAWFECFWDPDDILPNTKLRLEFEDFEPIDMANTFQLAVLSVFTLYLKHHMLANLMTLEVHCPNHDLQGSIYPADLQNLLRAAPQVQTITLFDALPLISALNPLGQIYGEGGVVDANQRTQGPYVCPNVKTLRLVQKDSVTTEDNSYRTQHIQGSLCYALRTRQQLGFPIQTLRLAGGVFQETDIRALEVWVGEVHMEEVASRESL